MAVSRAGARRAMVWGDDRGRVNIRVRAPNDALQQHNEHIPIGGGDMRTLDHRLMVDQADAAFDGSCEADICLVDPQSEVDD